MPDRDAARLLTLDIPTNARRHASFRDLSGLLRPRSLVVLNDTRVIPARLVGKKPTGGRVELLLVRRVEGQNTPHLNHSGESWEEMWEVLLRGMGAGAEDPPAEMGHHRPKSSTKGERGSGSAADSRDRARGACWALRRALRHGSAAALHRAARKRPRRRGRRGPRRRPPALSDGLRAGPGAVAAPTAGLHFTEPLLDGSRARVTRSRRSRCTSAPGPSGP